MDLASCCIVGEGSTSIIYEWGEGRVLKLVRDAAINEWAEAEFRDMNAAWRAGLPLPEPCSLIEIDGRKGVVMERIAGRSFPEMMFEAGGWRQNARSLAKLIHRINAAPLAAGEKVPMRRLKESLAWLIGMNDILTEGENGAALRQTDALPEGAALCHGDTHPYNVMVRRGGLVMMDWGSVSLGCPAYDAVYLSLVWRCAELPPELPAGFAQQFERYRLDIDGEFLREYKRLSCFTDADLERWLAPVAAGKGAIAASPGEKQALARIARAHLAKM